MKDESDAQPDAKLLIDGELDAVNGVDEPPVVARLVVEIRSDGSRTIARGGMEDRISGESVAVEARADSPIELASALARMILRSPSMAARAVSARSGSPGDEPRRGRKRRALARALRRRLLFDSD